MWHGIAYVNCMCSSSRRIRSGAPKGHLIFEWVETMFKWTGINLIGFKWAGIKYILILELLILQLGFAYAAVPTNSDLGRIASVLDSYHAAAAEGEWDTYFELMSEDGVFLGTDADERWEKEEFRAYASGRSGWLYRSIDRNINITPDGMSAWFDEILDSQSFGTSRGTGVLIKTESGWKISQYHLTFPVPNELSREVTDAIKAFEAAQ